MSMVPAPSGQSTVAAVMGHPISHSLSPAIHNAAFSACGLNWLYVAFDVEESQAQEAIAAVRALKLGGVSITMPLKAAAAAQADACSFTANKLKSANTLFWQSGKLIADSTDGEGFLASLAENNISVQDAKVVVLGAGGAARAVSLACVQSGAANVGIFARRASAAWDLVDILGAKSSAVEASAIKNADLIVNATPLGMAGVDADDALPFWVGDLGEDQVVIDLVYYPTDTALLRASRKSGAKAIGGDGMLLHQAALQFERWTGIEAPISEMRQAVLNALQSRNTGAVEAPLAHVNGGD